MKSLKIASKTTLIEVALLIAGVAFIVLMGQAQGLIDDPTVDTGPVTLPGTGDISPEFSSLAGFLSLMNTAANWFLAFVVVIAVILLIVAGFNYMTSGGDPEKVKSAKNKIIYAAIGIAVGLLARALIALVGNIVTGGIGGGSTTTTTTSGSSGL